MSAVTDLLNVPSRPIKQKIRLKTGRRSAYTKEAAQRFCAKIAEGYSLADICGKDGLPSTRQVFEWKDKYPDFGAEYARACEERGMHFGHKLTDLAAAVLAGEVDPQAARVAGDFYKFTAARLASKTWGEKSQVTVEHGVSAQAAEVLRELSGRARQRQIEAQYIDVTPAHSLSTGGHSVVDQALTIEHTADAQEPSAGLEPPAPGSIVDPPLPETPPRSARKPRKK